MSTTVRPDFWQRRRLLWQHAFFYAWLALTTVGPLTDRFASDRSAIVPLALIGAFAAWYAAWFLLRTPPRHRVQPLYLGGGVRPKPHWLGRESRVWGSSSNSNAEKVAVETFDGR